jgi:hypothetical protein
MAVKHQGGTVFTQHGTQFAAVAQRLAGAHYAVGRGMMQHQDCQLRCLALLRQHPAQARALRASQATTGQQRRRGQRRAQANERNPAMAMNVGPLARRAPFGQLPPTLGLGHGNQAIVVAGHHARRHGHSPKPGGGGGELRRQRKIGEVAGDQDAIRPMRRHVGEQRLEHHGTLHRAPAPP